VGSLFFVYLHIYGGVSMAQKENIYAVTYRCGHTSTISVPGARESQNVIKWLSTQDCPFCQHELATPHDDNGISDHVETPPVGYTEELWQYRQAKRKLSEAESFYAHTLERLMGGTVSTR